MIVTPNPHWALVRWSETVIPPGWDTVSRNTDRYLPRQEQPRGVQESRSQEQSERPRYDNERQRRRSNFPGAQRLVNGVNNFPRLPGSNYQEKPHGHCNQTADSRGPWTGVHCLLG